MSVATPQPRMQNPAMLLPGATGGIKKLTGATYAGGVPATTLALVHLRASQINGCSACVDSGARHAEESGETTQRLFAVARGGRRPTSATPSGPRWR